MLLKTVFCSVAFFGIGYILITLLYKTYFSRVKDNIKMTGYAGIMTFFLFMYIITALLSALLINGILFKVAMIFFALSPFIIGRFATYNTKVIYSALQILCVILSIIILFIQK